MKPTTQDFCAGYTKFSPCYPETWDVSWAAEAMNVKRMGSSMLEEMHPEAEAASVYLPCESSTCLPRESSTCHVVPGGLHSTSAPEEHTIRTSKCLYIFENRKGLQSNYSVGERFRNALRQTQRCITLNAVLTRCKSLPMWFPSIALL